MICGSRGWKRRLAKAAGAERSRSAMRPPAAAAAAGPHCKGKPPEGASYHLSICSLTSARRPNWDVLLVTGQPFFKVICRSIPLRVSDRTIFQYRCSVFATGWEQKGQVASLTRPMAWYLVIETKAPVQTAATWAPPALTRGITTLSLWVLSWTWDNRPASSRSFLRNWFHWNWRHVSRTSCRSLSAVAGKALETGCNENLRLPHCHCQAPVSR